MPTNITQLYIPTLDEPQTVPFSSHSSPNLHTYDSFQTRTVVTSLEKIRRHKTRLLITRHEPPLLLDVY